MSIFSEQFNELSFEVRAIACNLMLENQIRDLHLESDRLKRRYETSRKEINEKIKYCERELSQELGKINKTLKVK